MNTWQRHIDSANVAVAVFFSTDAALKCVAAGVIFTPHPYLSTPWNCLDAAMLAVDVMAGRRRRTPLSPKQRAPSPSSQPKRINLRHPNIRNSPNATCASTLASVSLVVM